MDIREVSLQQIINVVCSEMDIQPELLSTPVKKSTLPIKTAKEIVCLLAKKHIKKSVKNRELLQALGYKEDTSKYSNEKNKSGTASQIRRNVISANYKLFGVCDNNYYELLIIGIERRLGFAPQSAYNRNDTWVGKIKWVLSRSDSPLSPSQVSDAICQKEPHFQDRYDNVFYNVKKELSKNSAGGKAIFKSMPIDGKPSCKVYGINAA